MLKLENIKVRSFDLDYLDIFWEPVSGEDPLDYTFQVLRSEAQFGPYVPVTSTFKDHYRFRDTTAKQKHPTRKWYYKLRVTSTTDGAVTRDYPEDFGASLSALPPLDALEMARQFRLKLEEFKGRQVYLYPVRTFGPRCVRCWDTATQQKLRSSCPQCFDTAFTGGYHSPVRVSMEIVDTTENRQNADMALLHPKTGRGMLSNFPEVKKGDVVVEAENVRWRVTGPIMQKERLRYTFRQDFGLAIIPKDDVAFSLPVNVTAADIQPSPIREFTNPQSLDYFEYDRIELLDLEGTKDAWP